MCPMVIVVLECFLVVVFEHTRWCGSSWCCGRTCCGVVVLGKKKKPDGGEALKHLAKPSEALHVER